MSLFSVLRAATEGEIAPSFNIKLHNGENYHYAQNNNQVIILHFFATWCSACLVEMPALNEFYKKHHTEGLDLIAISMDLKKDERKAEILMQKFAFPFAFFREAEIKNYGRIWRIPLTFIIDRKGILKKDGWTQELPLSINDLEKSIAPLLIINSK